MTLVGELIDQGSIRAESADRATLAVRWLGVTVEPTRNINTGRYPTPAPGTQPAAQSGAQSGAEATPAPRGLRGITAGIRRLVDGPPGRHRAGHPTT